MVLQSTKQCLASLFVYSFSMEASSLSLHVTIIAFFFLALADSFFEWSLLSLTLSNLIYFINFFEMRSNSSFSLSSSSSSNVEVLNDMSFSSFWPLDTCSCWSHKWWMISWVLQVRALKDLWLLGRQPP